MKRDEFRNAPGVVTKQTAHQIRTPVAGEFPRINASWIDGAADTKVWHRRQRDINVRFAMPCDGRQSANIDANGESDKTVGFCSSAISFV
jgi:hypothetical protein